jgi:PEP-CTERM motif
MIIAYVLASFIFLECLISQFRPNTFSETQELLMKIVSVFLFTFLLMLSVNGNATEKGPINLVSLDTSSIAEENYNIEAETISEPKLAQRKPALPEPISMLLLGAGLVGLGAFARKKLLQI